VARIGVLGSTGMLGSVLAKVFTSAGHEVVEFNRAGWAVVGKNLAIEIDATWSVQHLEIQLAKFRVDYLVNAIGLIKQMINEFDDKSLLLAQTLNSDFPRKLSLISSQKGIPIIQIGTDCVFSGERDNYTESDEYSPADVYGRTKVDGEIESSDAMTIRASIVGKEMASNNSLLNWVLSQPINSRINGFTNHFWNGVTTLAFSKVVNGVIENNLYSPGVTHLVPRDFVSKRDLLSIIAKEFHREDLIIEDYLSAQPINRTLATIHSTTNTRYWALAGYNGIPTIEELIHEFAQWSSV
jgi:dTDP-4-dehydrorhamnose reductase